jgi:hypothetical protein
MKKIDYLIAAVGLLLTILITVFADKDTKAKNEADYVKVQEITDSKQNKRIEELEKEVRLLKTDLYILQNGYEGVEND